MNPFQDPPLILPNAVLTGSRAYGAPGPESDLDLVVLCSRSTAGKLLDLVSQGSAEDSAAAYEGLGERGLSLRFGKLNLLVEVEQARFEGWRDATALLVAKARESGPVSREEAKQLIKAKCGEVDA